MINYELKEVRTFTEAIESRQKIEGKINTNEDKKNKLQSKRRDAKEELDKLKAGKTTFKSIFTKGNK